MRISREHGEIERRLQQAWRREIATKPEALARSRRPPRVKSTGKIGQIYVAMIFLGLAFLPLPVSSLMAITLSTILTLYWACLLDQTSNNPEAKIISFHGGSDASLRLLAWRRLAVRAIAGALLAVVYFGIWWGLQRIPLWAWALGVLCYTLALISGPYLLAAAIPRKVLGWAMLLVCFGSLTGPLWVKPGLADQTSKALGILTPSGWTILMIKSLVTGPQLFWIVLPLLAGAAFTAWPLIRASVDRSLAGTAPEPERDEESSFPESPEFGEERTESSADAGELAAELAALKEQNLLDLPQGFAGRAKSFSTVKLVAIVLALAAIARFTFTYPDKPVFVFLIALAAAMGLPYLKWMPVTGMSIWLQDRLLSLNRTAAVFTLFPISYQRLMLAQIRRDLKTTCEGLPRAYVLGLAVLLIVFYQQYPIPAILAAGTYLSFRALLLLPTRWFNLSFRAISNRPFGWHNAALGFLVLATVVLLFIEILLMLLIVTTFNTFGEDRPLVVQVLILIGVGVVSAVLSGLGTYLTCQAYERGWRDAVKAPPKRS